MWPTEPGTRHCLSYTLVPFCTVLQNLTYVHRDLNQVPHGSYKLVPHGFRLCSLRSSALLPPYVILSVPHSLPHKERLVELAIRQTCQASTQKRKQGSRLLQTRLLKWRDSSQECSSDIRVLEVLGSCPQHLGGHLDYRSSLEPGWAT